ncbi:P-loop containing nucleoside triphosphate hydrolase protein [Blastocladiella britannica]|nr:P-loop containing nucleoside triphosphate hydrolase protein [Blastocladiella britannica]
MDAALDLYDEFGNYIGPDLDDGDEDDENMDLGIGGGGMADRGDLDHHDDEPTINNNADQMMDMDAATTSTAIILHEDKQYYPTHAQVYGDDVETMAQFEDAQPLSEPIIAPVVAKAYVHPTLAAHPPTAESLTTTYSRDFLVGLTHHPDLTRTVAVVGHLHHGKSALVDLLVEQTHPHWDWTRAHADRFSDTHPLARSRGMSLKCAPLSLVLPSTSHAGKNQLVHLVDTPGHADFLDEAAAAVRVADGALLVVDVIEGVMSGTRRLIHHLVRSRVPFALCVAKIDRLVLELRLPPRDAYTKLRHVVEEVNSAVAEALGDVSDAPALADAMRVSPDRGNVVFAMADLGAAFSLLQMATMYAKRFSGIDPQRFALRLWGDVAYDSETRRFHRMHHPSTPASLPRSFEHFVLEPIYKLLGVTLGESADTLRAALKSVGVAVKAAELQLDPHPLLRLVVGRFFGGSASGVMDAIAAAIPSAAAGAQQYAHRWLRAPHTPAARARHVAAVDAAAGVADAPLVMQVVKLFPRAPDAAHDPAGATIAYDALARVVAGTARVGAAVAVLGDAYAAAVANAGDLNDQDDEDEDDDDTVAKATITHLALAGGGRYSVPVESAPAGTLVLVRGIDATIVKSATVVAPAVAASRATARALLFPPVTPLAAAVMRVAVEPLVPSDLPKLLAGLRAIARTYPASSTRVHESGEHVLAAPGEMYLDCALHDLRVLFAEIEVKVGDPVAALAEGVVETSAVQVYATSANGKNKLTMLAEPVPSDVVGALDSGEIADGMPARERVRLLTEKYGWDALAARKLWAVGPRESGTSGGGGADVSAATAPANFLVDDTLVTDPAEKKLVAAARDAITRGFAWAARAGPLCDEPVRGVRFRLTAATLAPEPYHRSAGQLIPCARRLVHAAMLVAAPRLLEPIYAVEILAPADALAAVYGALARRRGHVVKDAPKPGTPLACVLAYVPVMDACGLEADIRAVTQGMAFSQAWFDHFAAVPGDPLDRSVVVRPLEPSPPAALARDFMIKTRRRKGLSEDVSVASVVEDEALLAVAREEMGQMRVFG